MWSFARQGFCPKSTLVLMSENALIEIDFFNAKEIADVVWAFAWLGHHPHDLFDGIGHRLLSTFLLDSMPPSSLSDLLWGFAMALSAQGLLEQLCQKVVQTVNKSCCADLCRICWACATLGIGPLAGGYGSVAFDEIDIDGDGKLSEAEIADAAMRQGADLHIVCGICQRISPVILHNLTTLTPVDISYMLWALAVWNVAEAELVRSLWQTASHMISVPVGTSYGELFRDGQATKLISRLFQAMLVNFDSPGISLQLRRQAEAVAPQWMSCLDEAIDKNLQLRTRICSEMRALGLEHREVCPSHDGLWLIDIAMPKLGVAILLDGPHHFVRGSHQRLGTTAYRDRCQSSWQLHRRSSLFGYRCIQARGWSPIVISIFEWNACKRTAAYHRLLQAKLRDVPPHLKAPSIAPGLLTFRLVLTQVGHHIEVATEYEPAAPAHHSIFLQGRSARPVSSAKCGTHVHTAL